MAGVLCLQGGREFTPPCEPMDRAVLAAVRPGPVAVLAGAARPGDDHDGAVTRARRHYERLGARTIGVPDPRDDRDAALGALTDEVGLLVLPGGSPSSLRSVLDAEIAQRVVDLYRRGMAISGASAGAMVLCERMFRPDHRDVVDGLGLVEGLALPHWEPGGDRGWPVPDGVTLWGLPECGGVILAGDPTPATPAHHPLAVGLGTPARRVDGEWRPLDERFGLDATDSPSGPDQRT